MIVRVVDVICVYVNVRNIKIYLITKFIRDNNKKRKDRTRTGTDTALLCTGSLQADRLLLPGVATVSVCTPAASSGNAHSTQASAETTGSMLH